MRIFAPSLLFSILLMSGCTWLEFPGVHKIGIQQGNIIKQEMVDKLKAGMSKSQVQFVMGTPLIVDSFNQTRWDYIYKYLSPTGVETEEQVTIFFDDKGLLKEVVGDYIPANLNK